MKKCLILILTILISVSHLPVKTYAKNGDIAGNYYSTDIKTYLNGHRTDAVNIGGKTLINAENMKYYGFDIYYSDGERRLDITVSKHAQNGAPPEVKDSDISPGKIMGNYLKTDITAHIGGELITSYNIGGTTYILAEELKNLGFDVLWSQSERTLSVTDPYRSGKVYSVFLSEGENPNTARDDQGIGAFYILKSDGKITGCGDAKLFHANLFCDGKKYTLNTAFYQNLGLFHSANITEILTDISYMKRGEVTSSPEGKYEDVLKHVKIMINGNEAKEISVSEGGGNGHIDFYFTINDLPVIKEDEIKSVYFSVGDTSKLDTNSEFEIKEPEKAEDQKLEESLKKYEYDFLQYKYETDTYTAVHMKESPSFGVIRDRLYIVDNETKTHLPDLLIKVRQFDGYNYDRLTPFDFKSGAVKNHFFFACMSEEKVGNFYADVNTGDVYFISEYTR